MLTVSLALASITKASTGTVAFSSSLGMTRVPELVLTPSKRLEAEPSPERRVMVARAAFLTL